MLSLIGYNFGANIHLFRWQELNIILDVNSGAIHLLDEISYIFIQRIVDYAGDIKRVMDELSVEFPHSDITEIVAEIEDAYEEGALFTTPDDLAVDLSNMNIKAICLNVAHACNMKCRYCFASHNGSWVDPGLMSIETGKQALDFLIEKSGDIKNLEIDFFGGEPLLNFDMLKELVRYGRERETTTGKRINFTLTSNAVLLDEQVTDFILDNDISVILSLDGRPEVNDRHRILQKGNGSYELIVPKITKLVQQGPISHYIRGTFTRKNLDFSSDLQHLAELGFTAISLEPAVGTETEYSIQEEDLPLVLNEYERLTSLLVDYYRQGKNIHFFHFNLDLQRGPCLAKRSSGCGAGIEYLAITPSGYIYPCHQFIGEDGYCMGNVYEPYLDKGIKAKFANNQLNNKEICKKCWARYFCGGGCHANAYHSNTDISIPSTVSCTMHRKRIEGAIYLEMVKNLEYL